MENSYPNAKYTMSFLEFLDITGQWFYTNFTMSTTARTTGIQNAIRQKWNLYEIAGETIGEMKLMLKDTFDYWKPYYEEMLTAYEKQFDYATDGITRVVEDEGEVKGIHVELPNKQIDATDIYKYPNDGDKDEHSNTVTTTDSTRFLEMKQKYMRQIRNLYNEYADKLDECFIHVFGGTDL